MKQQVTIHIRGTNIVNTAVSFGFWYILKRLMLGKYKLQSVDTFPEERIIIWLEERTENVNRKKA